MEEALTLDARLQTVFDLYPACEYAADIGSDHGKLPLALLMRDRCRRVAVTDISPGSLEKARRLFERFRQDSRADFLLGDGLSVLSRRPEAVSICGMGGKTLNGILRGLMGKAAGASLILAPQTDLALVRQTLYGELDYHITEEKCVLCGKRYYVVMRAEPGRGSLTPMEAELGPVLMKKRTPETLDYYAWRIRVLSVCQSPAKLRARQWYANALGKIPSGQNDNSK